MLPPHIKFLAVKGVMNNVHMNMIFTVVSDFRDYSLASEIHQSEGHHIKSIPLFLLV